jgi:hypothetical protein
MSFEALAMREFCGAIGKGTFEWLNIEMTTKVNGELSFCSKLFRAKRALKVEFGSVDRLMDLKAASGVIELVTVLASIDWVLSAVASLMI